MVERGSTLTKVCGIAYDFKDIERIVDFSIKYGFAYYYIQHQPDEEEKKEHFHFIIESDSKHRFCIRSLLTDTFTDNLFQKIKSVNAYLRYMTHKDYSMKNHYSEEDIVSNIDTMSIFQKIEDANPDKISREEQKKYEFYSVINSIEMYHFTTISQVIRYCIENNITYDLHWTYTLRTIMQERQWQIDKNQEKTQIFKN